MFKNNIVLFEPVIPANTGNIARTCAATNTSLHLIKPLGFKIDEKSVKRAGLDYWEKVEIVYHNSLDDFIQQLSENDRLFLISKFASESYHQKNFSNENNYFLFGKETTGLPKEFMQNHADQSVRIPQNDEHVRSLNLSNSAAVIIYEALRQQNFNGLDMNHYYQNDKLKMR